MKDTEAIDYILQKLQAELPPTLRYHSLGHTLSVLHSAEYIATKEGLKEEEVKIIRTAAAYHDSGFMVAYKNHEEIGCEIAQAELASFDYSEEEITLVQKMIMATKIPQSPTSILERVLCDADLDYLGGDNYGEISESLRDELGLNGIELGAEEWLNIQINFLEKHHYWTDFALKVLAPKKHMVLARLKAELKEQ